MQCVNIDLSAGSPSVDGSPPPSLAVSTCAAAQPVYPELSPDGRRLEEYGPKYSPKSPEYDPSYSPSASPSAAKENTPPPRDTSAVGPPRATIPLSESLFWQPGPHNFLVHWAFGHAMPRSPAFRNDFRFASLQRRPRSCDNAKLDPPSVDSKHGESGICVRKGKPTLTNGQNRPILPMYASETQFCAAGIAPSRGISSATVHIDVCACVLK